MGYFTLDFKKAKGASGGVVSGSEGFPGCPTTLNAG